jgi:hypothetical protein
VLLQRGLGGGELREVVAIVVVAARAAGAGMLLPEAVVVGERRRLVAPLLGLARGGRGLRAVGGRRRRFFGSGEVRPLEERVLGQLALELLVLLHRRQLQHADRLLQLRRERQMLR